MSNTREFQTLATLSRANYPYKGPVLAVGGGQVILPLPVTEEQPRETLNCCQKWELIDEGRYWAVVRDREQCVSVCSDDGVIECDHEHHEAEAVKFSKIEDYFSYIVAVGGNGHLPEYLYLTRHPNTADEVIAFRRRLDIGVEAGSYSAIGFVRYRQTGKAKETRNAIPE